MKILIVSGGEAPSEALLRKCEELSDYIIGADSGLNVLYQYNIKPDLILGDFDSVNKEAFDYFTKLGIEIRQFNPEKDYTDTDIAYEEGKVRGGTSFIFLGCTGTRGDHYLGNIGILLKGIKENVNIELIDDHNRYFLVDKETSLTGNYGETISFHALSDVVKGFSIKGAKYELKNYDLKLLEPRAVSNEFLEGNITISMKSGIILVIYSRD